VRPYQVISTLRGHDDKVRVILNKSDQVDHQQLMRVYGALMWSLGKVFKSPEVCKVRRGKLRAVRGHSRHSCRVPYLETLRGHTHGCFCSIHQERVLLGLFLAARSCGVAYGDYVGSGVMLARHVHHLAPGAINKVLLAVNHLQTLQNLYQPSARNLVA
jgi:hypothetical protein